MVELLIKGAKNLTAVKSGGTSDPFVKGWESFPWAGGGPMGVKMTRWSRDCRELCLCFLPRRCSSRRWIYFWDSCVKQAFLFRLIPPSRIIKSTVHSSLISRFSTLTLKLAFNRQHFQSVFVLPLDSVTSQLPLRSKRQQVWKREVAPLICPEEPDQNEEAAKEMSVGVAIKVAVKAFTCGQQNMRE